MTNSTDPSRSLPLILMYHNIAAPPAGARIKGMYVTGRQFDWQIGWLKRRGYEFTTFSDLLQDKSATARQVILTLDDGYENNYHNAFPILKKHDAKAVIYPILTDLGRRGVTWPGATEQTPANMMSPTQIREMADAGIEFGSHLLHHRRLTSMAESERAEELARSKSGLEEITGQTVVSIAYPYGDFDDAVVEQTREAGYRYAVTTEPGNNNAAGNSLRLNRYTAKGCKLYHPLKFQRMIRSAEKQDC